MQTYEYHDLVNPIDEFGREMGLNGRHHHLSRLRLHWTFAHIIQENSTQVGCHDDHGISEIHNAALTICKSPIIQDLEEQRHEFPACFLDLVDEHYRIWFSADVFRELATLAVTNVAWGRANETTNRVLFGVFRAINTDHGIRRVEEKSGEL
jgi:hypothetical protein